MLTEPTTQRLVPPGGSLVAEQIFAGPLFRLALQVPVLELVAGEVYLRASHLVPVVRLGVDDATEDAAAAVFLHQEGSHGAMTSRGTSGFPCVRVDSSVGRPHSLQVGSEAGRSGHLCRG